PAEPSLPGGASYPGGLGAEGPGDPPAAAGPGARAARLRAWALRRRGRAVRRRGAGVVGPGRAGAPAAGRDAAGLPLPAPRPPLEGVAGRAVRGTPRARAVRRGSAQGGPPGPDGDGAQGGGGRPGGADGGVPGGGAGPQAGPLAPAVQYQPAGARRGAGTVPAAAAARAGLPGGRTRRVPGRRAVRLRQAEPRPRAAPLAAGAVADDRLAGGPGVQ